MGALASVLIVVAVADYDEEPSRWRFGADLSFGPELVTRAAPRPVISGALELGIVPTRHLRLSFAAKGFWEGASLGGVHLLAGADFVLPKWWGEWFVGAAAGAVYANTFMPAGWAWAVRARFGIDILIARPVYVGLAAQYTFVDGQQGAVIAHLPELVLRFGVAW
jgi:hypothetical protein